MSRKTNKTAPLLNLLTKTRSDIENPMINEEFKEDVIHIRQPKSVHKASAQPPASEEVGINIVEELVHEWLPETMRRFCSTDSDINRAEITVQALNQIPPKYVYLRGEKDFEVLQNMKDAYKGEVISTLVRLALSFRSNAVHLSKGTYERIS